MNSNQVARHVKRNYTKMHNGVAVRFSAKMQDVFVEATADDKWQEYNSNTKMIERDGYVWSRVRVQQEK